MKPVGVLQTSAYLGTWDAARCFGPTRAKLVWEPDPNLPAGAPPDLPPKCVVLLEDAFTHSSFPAWGGGNATTGFAGERRETSYANGGAYINAYYRRYRVIYDPGNEILPDPCNAEATASYGTSINPYFPATTMFGYYACATPLVVISGGDGYVNSAGTYVSQGKNLLIGQRLTAEIARPIDYRLDKASTGSDPVAQWAIEGGGDPFKSFEWVTANAATGATDSHGGRHDLEPGDLDKPALQFSFAQPGSATVTCIGHIATPPGSIPAGGLDIQFSSSSINIENLDPDEYDAKVAIPLEVIDEATRDGASVGMVVSFSAKVVTPSKYYVGNDHGGWLWMQTLSMK